MTTKPNPGSPEAVDAGCTCPVLDNGHGRGCPVADEHFWMSADCPLHGWNLRGEEPKMEDIMDDKSMRKGYDELEQIVRGLAAAHNPSVHPGFREDPPKCPLCRKQTLQHTRKRHFLECPYRRAVEWVEEMERGQREYEAWQEKMEEERRREAQELAYRLSGGA